MTDLPEKPTLIDLQDLVRDMVKERGFDKETVPEVFMVLIEEVGEFAKANRKAHGMKMNQDARAHNLEDEAADVLFMLLDLCNRLDIDLEQAFRDKEAKNQKRQWAN